MITGLYAGILGFILTALVLRIAMRRRRYLVGIGDGGIEDLSKAIRVHGNFVETVPIILILMTLMELGAMEAWFIHLYGILLVIARGLHIWGLSSQTGHSKGRFYGVILSLSLILLGSSSLVFMYIR